MQALTNYLQTEALPLKSQSVWNQKGEALPLHVAELDAAIRLPPPEGQDKLDAVKEVLESILEPAVAINRAARHRAA